MAGVGAGLICFLCKHPLMNGFKAPRNWKDDCASVVNAFLGGMVANGAGMDQYLPWESFVVGVIGSCMYMILCKIFDILKVDDAVEAFQLHGGCGSVGAIAPGFFGKKTGVFWGNSGKHILY
jgi:ammonium transporter, Amt family